MFGMPEFDDRPRLIDAAAWLRGDEDDPRFVAMCGFRPAHVVFRYGADQNTGYAELAEWCAPRCAGGFFVRSTWEVYFERLEDAEAFHDVWCAGLEHVPYRRPEA